MGSMDNNSKPHYTAFIANLELFEKLSETRPQLRELLDDHNRLLEAITYCRSEVKVAEFFHLALELEEEIMEYASADADRPGQARQAVVMYRIVNI